MGTKKDFACAFLEDNFPSFLKNKVDEYCLEEGDNTFKLLI